MSFFSSFKSVAGAVAVTSVALVGLVSPAIAQDRTALLEEGETTKMEAFLLQGESVYATCDSDCSDIDMTLYTEMGVEVDDDFEMDDYPNVTAPYAGTFLVEVSMASCNHPLGCEVFVESDEGF